MLDSYAFRFAFCEMCTMAATLYFLVSVLPCRRNKKGAILIGYIASVIYTTIMLVTGKDISGDGVIFRYILFITSHIIIPCYLINDKSWYRYIGICIIGDIGSSVLGTVFLTPLYYLLTGGSTQDMPNYMYDLYYKQGMFYLMFLYVVCNSIAYILVTILLKKLMKSEKIKKHIINIAQGSFILIYILIGIIALHNSLVLLQSISAISFISELVAFIFIIRGMIWEKTVDAKNREMIQIRESIQYEKYIKIQEKQQRARKILHDLADHMTTVQLLLDKGDMEKAKDYLQSYNIKE